MRSPYTPPIARVEDPVDLFRSISRVSNLIGLKFALPAAVVVALGTAATDRFSDHANDPFGPSSPGFLLFMAGVLSIGTLTWSWFICMLTARVPEAKRRASSVVSGAFGVGFGLLTPALGFLVYEAPFGIFIAVMAVWVLAFPIVSTVLIVRRASSPNTSLERTRDR